MRREGNRDIGKGRKKMRVEESSRERMRGDGRGGIQKKGYTERKTMV